jgi:hypothetical protein
MNKKVEIDGKMYELKPIKAKPAKKKHIGLAYWTKGNNFKVIEKTTYTAKNGKVYDAVRGIDKFGKELVLKSTYGGTRWTKDNF